MKINKDLMSKVKQNNSSIAREGYTYTHSIKGSIIFQEYLTKEEEDYFNTSVNNFKSLLNDYFKVIFYCGYTIETFQNFLLTELEERIIKGYSARNHYEKYTKETTFEKLKLNSLKENFKTATNSNIDFTELETLVLLAYIAKNMSPTIVVENDSREKFNLIAENGQINVDIYTHYGNSYRHSIYNILNLFLINNLKISDTEHNKNRDFIMVLDYLYKDNKPLKEFMYISTPNRQVSIQSPLSRFLHLQDTNMYYNLINDDFENKIPSDSKIKDLFKKHNVIEKNISFEEKVLMNSITKSYRVHQQRTTLNIENLNPKIREYWLAKSFAEHNKTNEKTNIVRRKV